MNKNITIVIITYIYISFKKWFCNGKNICDWNLKLDLYIVSNKNYFAILNLDWGEIMS